MKKLKKGFTLIELMIVVAIIAILAAVAAPRFGTQIARSRDGRAVALAGTWQSALSLDYSEEETYATDFGRLFNDVDDATVRNTFNETTRATNVTAASGDDVFVRAGTADANNSAGLTITGTATGSAINFVAGITNTRGVAWNTVLFN